MTLYNKDFEELKYLIPLYVKGLLSDSERQKFEEALIGYPELRAEVEIWEKLNNAYEEIDRSLPTLSGQIYSKIAKKIIPPKRISLFDRFILSRRRSLAFIAAQFLIIITLGLYIITLKTEYQTLSIPSVTTDKSVKINIVFQEKASEAEIRRLLLQTNGKIINGPYRSGLYVIEVSDEKGIENVLNILKKDRIVVMAEKVY